MQLLLDIGNTRIKWAWLEGAALRAGGAVVHRGRGPQAALDALDVRIRPAAVVAASVAGAAMQAAVDDWAARAGLPLRWLRSRAAACGVRNAYARPEQLGVDRWLAVIGAYARGGASLVVDAGTALTLDVVDREGRHRGGLIAPGVQTQREALHQGTQLPPVQGESAPGWLAQDTRQAIAWGTLQAAAGLIGRIQPAVQQELGPLQCLLTGGEAELLLPLLGQGWSHVPDLVLEGLAQMARES